MAAAAAVVSQASVGLAALCDAGKLTAKGIIMQEKYSTGSFIYDPKVYDGLNRQQDDIAFYLQWIKDNHISKVLELCCGTGRITIPLAKAGVHISGFDLTAAMLEEAENKAKNEKLAIPFFQGYMRTMSLPESYQMNPFTAGSPIQLIVGQK